MNRQIHVSPVLELEYAEKVEYGTSTDSLLSSKEHRHVLILGIDKADT